MGLPEWCQTHTLHEFLLMMEDQPKKERNMTNVESFTHDDVALEALDAFNAVESNLTDDVYNAGPDGDGLREVLAEKEADGEVEVFEQADPADAVILN